MQNILKTLDIILVDVSYMTAGKRHGAVRLLIKTSGMGNRIGDIRIAFQLPDASARIDQPRVLMTIDEVLEAVQEAS